MLGLITGKVRAFCDFIIRHKTPSAIVGGVVVVLITTGVVLGQTLFKAPEPEPAPIAEQFAPIFSQEIEDTIISEPPEPEKPTPDDPYYVLLMGADSRTRDLSGTRSDAILLIRVDEAKPLLTVVSLPRDSLAEIPGYGSDKINAALAYGGRDLAEQAVEKRLGVDIRYTALLGFHTSTALIDKLGGVFVDVDANMSFGTISLTTGPQTLNGKQALTFARCRKELARGDFHRVEHHRDLFIATFDKLANADPTDFPTLATKILPYLETNIPMDKALNLLTFFKGYDSTQILEATVPSYSGSYNGGSYVFVEEEPWAAMLARINQGLPPVDGE